MNSAVTARAAADRAQQGAVAAADSGAQAEFSASYARASVMQAEESAQATHAAALAKSEAEAATAATDAWNRTIKLREQEEAEARKPAEQQRKAERESAPHCYLYPTRDSLPPCTLGGQPITPAPIDPLLKEAVWAVLGLNDAKDCVRDPTLGKCPAVAAAVMPWGKAQGAEGRRRTGGAAKASRLRDIPGIAVDPGLLDELAANGVTFTREEKVVTARTKDGQIIFLEQGDRRRGLRTLSRSTATSGLASAEMGALTGCRPCPCHGVHPSRPR
jgi:hypothetical protein